MANNVPVLVTGFGPFGEHKINASWEAVKELKGLKFDKNIVLKTSKIPVEYTTVSTLIPDLWQTFKPKLVVHVGVSPVTDVVQLETCAHNSGYCREDISHKYPDGCYCVFDGEECLHTNIDVEKLCRETDKSKCPCKLEASDNAGRYLCEFIYYKSLNQSLKQECNSSSVLFIHVPTLNSPYSKKQLAQAIKYVVHEILKQQGLVGNS